MRYWVDVEGDEEARRKVAQLLLLVSDLRGFWPLVVPLFTSWMARQFSSEGAFGGQSWAPLSPAYAAYKAQAHPGKTILIAEGDLRQAASRPDRQASPRQLTLTITDPKVGYHQEGTTKMPARPLLFDRLPAQAQAELNAAAETYVTGIVRRLF